MPGISLDFQIQIWSYTLIMYPISISVPCGHFICHTHDLGIYISSFIYLFLYKEVPGKPLNQALVNDTI